MNSNRSQNVPGVRFSKVGSTSYAVIYRGVRIGRCWTERDGPRRWLGVGHRAPMSERPVTAKTRDEIAALLLERARRNGTVATEG